MKVRSWEAVAAYPISGDTSAAITFPSCPESVLSAVHAGMAHSLAGASSSGSVTGAEGELETDHPVTADQEATLKRYV